MLLCPSCGTFPPDADAAKPGLRRQTNRYFRRGSAARLPQTGHSNRSNTRKSNPVVRCDGVERLTCGRSRLMPVQENHLDCSTVSRNCPRRLSTIYRDRTFKSCKWAETETGHSLRTRSISHQPDKTGVRFPNSSDTRKKLCCLVNWPEMHASCKRNLKRRGCRFATKNGLMSPTPPSL